MSSSLTRSQQVALAIAPKVTGLLSALGSSWIVVEVLSQETKRHNVYNRILCAMSFVDALSSVWFFASTWPIPEGTEGVAFAKGNGNVCVAQGFFLQLGMTSPYYNFSLALYYMLVVKYNVSEETLRRKFEPFVHVLCVLFGLGPAIAGVSLDLYNAANLWCWIAPFPPDCLDSYTHGDQNSNSCIRGDNAWIFRWAFYFVPLWAIIILVTIIMASVYLSVRKKEKEALADFLPHDGERRPASAVDSITPTMEKTTNATLQPPISSVRKGPEKAKCNEHQKGPPPPMKPTVDGAKHKKRPSIMKVMSDRLLLTGSDNTMLVPRGLMHLIGGGSGNSDVHRVSMSNSIDTKDIDYVVETIEEYTSARCQVMELNQFGTKVVFQQFILYTLGFYICYTFATINRIVEHVTGTSYFGLLFIHVILIPLQGLFNVLVYRYGYYFRLQQRYPDMTRWELFEYIWRWSFMGPPRNLSPGTNNSSVPPLPTSPSTRNKAHSNGILNSVEIIESTSPYPEVAEYQGSEAGSEILDQADTVNILDDGLEETPTPVGNMMADMLYKYSEYPSMASGGEDMVLVTTAFPTMVGRHSSDRGLTPRPLTPN